MAGIPGLEPVLWLAPGVVAALYLARQLRRFRDGQPVNLPKMLLLLGVAPLHWWTFELVSWQAAAPTVTIVHNLQYHAIIRFHNRNRYGAKGGGNLATYIMTALAFSALYRIPGYELGRISDVAFGFFSGFGLTHYYLDSKIWRVREDRDLRRALELA